VEDLVVEMEGSSTELLDLLTQDDDSDADA
jgi:hypothetical protein